MGDAVAEAVLAQWAALPKTGKPQPHEHTVLAGIAVALPPPAAAQLVPSTAGDSAVDGAGTPVRTASTAPALAAEGGMPDAALGNPQQQRQQQLVVVALATGTKCLGASKRLPGGVVLNDCHAEALCRRALVRWVYGEAQAAVAEARLQLQQPGQQRAELQQSSKQQLELWKQQGKRAASEQCCIPPSPQQPVAGQQVKAAALPPPLATGSRVFRLVPPATTASSPPHSPGIGSSSDTCSRGESVHASDPLGGWRLELQPGVTFHMYVSQPPCGDASIITHAGGCDGHATGTSGADSSGAAAAAGRTGAKPIKRMRLDPAVEAAEAAAAGAVLQTEERGSQAELEGIQRGQQAQQAQQAQRGHEEQQVQGHWALPQAGDVESYAQVQATGVVRRKPGKGEATLSLSCSDKLARWQLLGLQGSLLSGALARPLRLSSLTVAVPSVPPALEEQGDGLARWAGAVAAAGRRALVGRTAELAAARLGTSALVPTGAAVGNEPGAAAHGATTLESAAGQVAAAAPDVAAGAWQQQVEVCAYAPVDGRARLERLGLSGSAQRKVGSGSSVVWHAPPSASFPPFQQHQAAQHQAPQQHTQQQPQRQPNWATAAVDGAGGSSGLVVPTLLPGSSGSLEAVAGSTGLRAGSSRKGGAPIKPSARSAVCKAALWSCWRHLAAAMRALPAAVHSNSDCNGVVGPAGLRACGPAQQRQQQAVVAAATAAAGAASQPHVQQSRQRQQTYREGKLAAGAAYQCTWRGLLQPPSPFEGWVVKPAELEDFGAEDRVDLHFCC